METVCAVTRVASSLERSLLSGGSGALHKQNVSISELNRQLSESGRRPSWNLQAKPVAPKDAEEPQASLTIVKDILSSR